MVRLEPIALSLLAVGLALAAWAPASSAGTSDAPEVTDATDDHTIAGTIPLAGVGQFINADVTAAWVEDAGADLTFTIQLQGAGTPTTTTNYAYVFHFDVGGTAGTAECALGAASPVGSGAAEPGGAATACVNGENLIVMTVPKAAISAAAGTTLTGLFVEATGTPITDPLSIVEDRAPDADFGTDYTVGGGGGSPGDTDGDGLNDTEEVEQFGDITAQNGTGDPDQDGLNNSAEFAAGTNATDPDTDGDGVDDGEDPAPLDPDQPGGNGTGGQGGHGGHNVTDEDTDGDGLPDDWEQEHFGNLTSGGDDDPDGDDLDNHEEYEQETDPTNADTDGDGLADNLDPAPLEVAEDNDRLEMYVGAPMFAAIATLCLFGLARK